jgi:hypothetical protein
LIFLRQDASALAGNGDVFITAGMVAATAGGLGNRSRDFVRVDAPVGRSLGEFPRLTIGPCGMRAAFFALGEALVDAITVRLVGDDENAALGGCCRRGEEERADQKR